MTVALCSPDGRPFELDDSQLCEFAIANKLIDNASHFSNVTNLINPSSGKKQLQPQMMQQGYLAPGQQQGLQGPQQFQFQ